MLTGSLGKENEGHLVTYIKKVQASEFPLTGETLRKLAFQFAERNEILHRFSRDKCMAGWEWLDSFLRRYPGLIRKKPLGLSFDRAMAVNRKDIEDYFNLLLDVLTEHNLLDKPGHIYNIDDSGFQMNPKPDTVIAEKGSSTLWRLVKWRRQYL
jgi:hypothetical protein